jgi:hypothetical protein
MVFQFQYSSVHEVTEPKADVFFGVDVVRRLIYYGSSTALKLPVVRLVLSTDSESEACMAWDYCLGNARVLGLHSPQHYPNPIGKFNFGTSVGPPAENTYRNGRGEWPGVRSGCPSDGIATRSDARKSFGSPQS